MCIKIISPVLKTNNQCQSRILLLGMKTLSWKMGLLAILEINRGADRLPEES